MRVMVNGSTCFSWLVFSIQVDSIIVYSNFDIRNLMQHFFFLLLKGFIPILLAERKFLCVLVLQSLLWCMRERCSEYLHVPNTVVSHMTKCKTSKHYPIKLARFKCFSLFLACSKYCSISQVSKYDIQTFSHKTSKIQIFLVSSWTWKVWELTRP